MKDRPLAMLLGVFLFIIFMILACCSCTHTKRDCQGVKHVKLKNGIYLWYYSLKPVYGAVPQLSYTLYWELIMYYIMSIST